MTERKPKKGAPAVPTRTPGKREPGIFDNLRRPTTLHPMEEILQLPPPPPSDAGATGGDLQPGGESPPGGISPPGGVTTRGPVAPPPDGESPPGGDSPPVNRAETGGDLQPVVIDRLFTKTLNWYYDDLARTLTSAQQSVFAQLYRLTIGYNRATCLISIPKLAERCGFEETAVRRGLKGLEARGLVRRVKDDMTNPDRSLRGLTFQVIIPSGTPGVVPPGGESQPGGQKQPGGKRPPMKDSLKESHETPDAAAPAPVLEILKKIAASYRHANPNATADDVADRLREWFKTEGREANEELINEALAQQ